MWASMPSTLFPALDLRSGFRSEVEIASVDLVETSAGRFVRVTSKEGDLGVVAINNKLEDCLSIYRRRVVPFFIGKDAREIEELIDEVYVFGGNYKFAGMPFWNAVAHVEMAVLDMLGRLKKRTVGELLGTVRLKEIPFYVTRFERNNSPEEEVSACERILDWSGAKAIKLRVGLRMANSRDRTRRDVRMVELARKKFGDEIAIYLDANGSYTAKEAITIGREFEKSGVAFLEEPCPWEDYGATKKVTDKLKLTIAGGEQDTSLNRIEEMIKQPIVNLIQPDVYYCGGLIRTLRVAKMAKTAGCSFSPHNPRRHAEAAPALHLASIAESFGPSLEIVESGEMKNGILPVPKEPGLGLGGDTEEWRNARVL